MDLFSELITAVQSDLTVGNDSSFMDGDTVKLAINRAYRKAGGLFLWPDTKDAQKTSTQATIEYYDYPANWRSNSIWKLRVDGVDYGEPLLFKDYLYDQENKTTIRRPSIMWSNEGRRYFIDPAPTANGNDNIEIWGQKIVDKLVGDNDVTIFSYSMPECNEAVVGEAVAILKNKGELQQPVMRSFIGGTQLINMEAQNTLTIAWKKIQETNSKYQKTMPFFTVPDFFRPRHSNRRVTSGDFGDLGDW